ncbi:putative nuclear RNA export factor SDE5 [Abrus precatorius]|uniref:Nuclear RNA export factor SDE5 n=1 Tax=Abrus precatorius TaxID=3816 RepID=A0A8B8KGP7_ABRPR|nr:putative nuclear RNA export factor SDE5 [Abrus precatorius]
MEAKSPDSEQGNLRGLLESFGSAFALEDIANAYWEAKQDVNLAAEILCGSKDELKGAINVSVPKSFHGAVKSGFRGASLGNVAGVVGRDCIQPKTWSKSKREVRKPLKLDAKEFPESVIWGEKPSLSAAAAKGTVSDEVVDFLYRMLEEGFELDKNKIHDVLGLCGYDVQKTMEELLDESASTLEKCNDVRDLAGENHIILNVESDDDENSYKALRQSVREHWLTMKEYYRAAVDAFVKSDYARADRLREQGHFFNRMAREADEKSAQKLFRTNETNDDEIPLDLHEHEPKQALHLLKLHLTSLSGIHGRQQFLCKSFDYGKNCMAHLDPINDIRTLTFPAIKYLRVIVGTGDEDRKGARKKLIIKLLNKNSIKWTEEDIGRTLLLQVDVIDRKSLSFAQKS